MERITKDKFSAEYLIYKELTPHKQYKTYLAMRKRADGGLYPVILKETDEKRAAIYQSLTGMWNPYLTDTYDVLFVLVPDNPAQNHFVAVTEYVRADGSPEEECLSLSQFVRKNGVLSEPAALAVCVQICEGLKEFHKEGFVHRDLKPDNIMISKYDLEHPQIKITDFGDTKQRESFAPADTTVVGTLGYQPPESLSSHTTQQSDIYSIGCILNFMLTGLEPGVLHYKKNHYIISIIEKATNADPSHRYSNVTTLQKQLEHELRTKLLDRIPLVRALPGFRTHTLWKEVVSLFAYISMILLAVICLEMSGIRGFAEVFVFYIAVPLVILFNMGNLLRFFPENLRRNNRLFLMIRTSIMLVTIFLPMLFDYLTGG